MSYARKSLTTLFAAMDQTCLVMIDRSMWFGKSFEALRDNNFQPLVQRHPYLRGSEKDFQQPLTYAFIYAQRCSFARLWRCRFCTITPTQRLY